VGGGAANYRGQERLDGIAQLAAEMYCSLRCRGIKRAELVEGRGERRTGRKA
jgi:hypothetical protein